MLWSSKTLMEEVPAKTLSTRQLARLWRVSEATIKRWADAGFLRPSRTLGGHRRFALEEVARFQNERGLSPAAPAPVRAAKSRGARVRARLVQSFFEAIHRGHEGEAAALLLEAYLDGVPLSRLFDETVAAAMHLVGRLWHSAEFSVADEHLATRTAVRALEALRTTVRCAPHAGGRIAFCCALEDELHEVAVLCAQILLEAGGWGVKNFGANMPLFALAEMLERDCPQLVCISSTTPTALDRNAREYTPFRASAQVCGALVVLGGEGFRDDDVRQRFPADLHAENFRDLTRFIKATS